MTPIKIIAITTCNNFNIILFGCGKNGRDKSTTIDIIIAFNRVPIQAFCLIGVHSNNTKTLTMKVVIPVEKPVTKDKPWCNTNHGLTPMLAVMIKVSPMPKKISPIIK